MLYQCLAGQAPFRAPHVAAVLAKILFSEPTRLSELRPELPASLVTLVEQMLAKEPSQRPADARHLLHALDQLEGMPQVAAPGQPRSSPSHRLTQAEQHLVSVLLVTLQHKFSEAPTLDGHVFAQARQSLEHLFQELQMHGARAALLADGSLLATLQLERGTAADQARVAAHCALSAKERLQNGLVVLTTGLALRDQPMPVGEVMDRAGEILRKQQWQKTAVAQVMVDDVTAGLLGPRFQLDRSTAFDTFLLYGEHLSVDGSRPLLGRPTPCVGRQQELAMLELALSGCLEESSARAVLITALPGTGKSRLRHEFLRRLEQLDVPRLVLLGRGDPMNSGSAYGLIGEAVRRLCGILDGEPLELRREKLGSRISRHLPSEYVKDTTEFLGELCGVAFPLEDSPKLRAARADPVMMNVQVRQAMVRFLQAELSLGPVLLVLEDLHWSDAPTVRLVEELLRELSERPLMVLALARPEVEELFPRLWTKHLQELPLRGLSQKASTRLIQEVLGPDLPEEVVNRLVELAAGNALFLEELIRGEAEGRGHETPGTVLAMLQSRLQRLEPGPRRVLLAASIFGRSFWVSGIQDLVEEEFSTAELKRSLRHLSELELVQPQASSRFPEEIEYRFRHALVRDAAYSLVPGDLKPVGHRLVGAWLERTGEQDPWVLAEHYQLGQQRERAVHFFTRAGEQLYKRQDMTGAERCVKAALECAPTGQALAELRVLEVLIAFWLDDFERVFSVGDKVWPQLPLGSVPWARITSVMILVGAMSNRHADMARLGRQLLSTAPLPDARVNYIEAATFLTAINSWHGLRSEAHTALECLTGVGADMLSRDSLTRGWTYLARAYVNYFLEARPWQASLDAEEAVRSFREANSERNMTTAQAFWGQTLAGLGDRPRAIAVIRDAIKYAQRAGQTYAGARCQMPMMLVLSSSRDAAHQEETGHLARHLLETRQGNLMFIGAAHLALARVAVAQGRYTEAETHARRACELEGVLLHIQIVARALLSAALRAQGRVTEARAEAEACVLLEGAGGLGAASVGAWLALAEACFAQGDPAAGDQALEQASRRMNLRAKDLPDATTRELFLSEVPENARTRELAYERWGEDRERLTML